MNYEECFEFMKEKHEGQYRKHGVPYYTHPLAVSQMLKEKGFSIEYQIAGLFHDLIEDTDATYAELLEYSSPEVVEAVRLVTKEPGYDMEDYISRIKNSEIARYVKLADRVHNLSQATLVNTNFPIEYLEESNYWYSDLAKGTVFEEEFNNVIEKVKREIDEREYSKE